MQIRLPLFRSPLQRALGLMLVALASTAGPSSAQAQEPVRIPTHAGHRFLPLVEIPDPFIKTFIRNSVGLGTAFDLKTPSFEFEGQPVDGLRGNLLAALLEFEYQQGVNDWLAARVRFKVSGRLGTDVQSLLAQGITGSTTFELGWLFRLHQTEKTLLSGTFDVSNGSFTSLSLTAFINDIIAGRDPNLVYKTPTIRSGPGLRYAWAANDLVGVILNGRTGYGESSNRSTNDEWFYRLGAAVDFDLKARTSVPLGLAVGYYLDSLPEGGDAIAKAFREWVLRISYTGPGDFLVSLDMSWGKLPLRDFEDEVQFGSTAINLRYYF